MSNKQKTAVDWLAEQMLWNEFHNPYLERAKEMEKEQKIDAYNQGRHNGQTNWGFGNDITAEQYYKETYEGNK